MTTLGNYKIKSKSNSKWYVSKHIAGDLSFSYEVRPRSFLKPDGLYGFGIPANKLSDVDKIIKLCNKHGYDKASNIWLNSKIRGKTVRKGYHFGYLRGAEARKYARSSYAYGEYAEKLKRQR